ncbi:Uncharacterised protein [uncultured Roseburia sp.]|nr:Uncharacterised protein [uncultured Roseburia sp.]
MRREGRIGECVPRILRFVCKKESYHRPLHGVGMCQATLISMIKNGVLE